MGEHGARLPGGPLPGVRAAHGRPGAFPTARGASSIRIIHPSSAHGPHDTAHAAEDGQEGPCTPRRAPIPHRGSRFTLSPREAVRRRHRDAEPASSSRRAKRVLSPDLQITTQTSPHGAGPVIPAPRRCGQLGTGRHPNGWRGPRPSPLTPNRPSRSLFRAATSLSLVVVCCRSGGCGSSLATNGGGSACRGVVGPVPGGDWTHRRRARGPVRSWSSPKGHRPPSPPAPRSGLFPDHRPGLCRSFPSRDDLFGACAGGRGGSRSLTLTRYYPQKPSGRQRRYAPKALIVFSTVFSTTVFLKRLRGSPTVGKPVSRG